LIVVQKFDKGIVQFTSCGILLRGGDEKEKNQTQIGQGFNIDKPEDRSTAGAAMFSATPGSHVGPAPEKDSAGYCC
jgi:hypothetical protein